MNNMGIESKLEARLTILVPTYNRAPKLRRFLNYLLRIEPHQKALLPHVDIVIADGSDQPDHKNIQLIEQLEKIGVGIRYCHFPRLGLQERFAVVSTQIETSHVLVCGDDDLVDFGGIGDWLENKYKIAAGHVYAGRFLNILGPSIFGLKVDCLERPYYGFKIAAEDVKTRLLMHGVANAFGITTLSYAIQPTFLFREFWSMTKGQILYYGGLEFAHQVFLTARSKVFFSEKTLIFRDFTYIDYKYEKLREAPATDKYPYLGEEAVNLAVQIISKNCPVDATMALDIIEEIIEIQASVLPSRLRFQNEHTKQGKRLRLSSDPVTVSAVQSAWFRTYLEAYPRKEAVKRFLGLSLPGCTYNFLRKLVIFLKNI